MNSSTWIAIAFGCVAPVIWAYLKLFGKVKPSLSHTGAAAGSVAVMAAILTRYASNKTALLLIEFVFLGIAFYCVIKTNRMRKTTVDE